MKIECIRHATTTELAIQKLQEYIVSARLQPGSRLLSENALCEKFQVSRIVVREAMQHFKSLGIIGTRPQRGAFIKQLIPDDPYRAHLPYLGNDPDIPGEIAQLRAIVETGLLQEILHAISEEELDRLDEINGGMLKAGRQRRLELDIAFHVLLLEVPKNRLLAGLRSLLFDYFQTSRAIGRHAAFTDEGNRKVYEEHCRIITALRERNEAKAQAAFKAHIGEYWGKAK